MTKTAPDAQTAARHADAMMDAIWAHPSMRSLYRLARHMTRYAARYGMYPSDALYPKPRGTSPVESLLKAMKTAGAIAIDDSNPPPRAP